MPILKREGEKRSNVWKRHLRFYALFKTKPRRKISKASIIRLDRGERKEGTYVNRSGGCRVALKKLQGNQGGRKKNCIKQAHFFGRSRGRGGGGREQNLVRKGLVIIEILISQGQ